MAAAKKPLLHEILAIEQETKTSAERARSETINTFRTKQNHFTGIRRTFRPFSVDEQLGESSDEQLEAETRLVRTVVEELEGLFGSISESVDLGYKHGYLHKYR